MSQTTFDIHVAVNGQTGSGAQGTGAGIYWSCDDGNSYVEDDNGIAASDKPLLWKVYADPSTFTTQPARTCPTNMASITTYAGTIYAALLGGGSVYKTTNGGATWALANTGLPTGVEVFSLAIDCGAGGGAGSPTCANPQLLYAATSAGVYKSTNGGASWAIDGLQGSVVNAVITEAEHANIGIAASPNGATETGNTATFTLTAAPGFAINAGDTIIIFNVGAGYNGTFTVASVISSTQFTVTLPTSGLAPAGGGLAVRFAPRVYAGTNQVGGLFQANAP
jgi:hypothetical protein